MKIINIIFLVLLVCFAPIIVVYVKKLIDENKDKEEHDQDTLAPYKRISGIGVLVFYVLLWIVFITEIISK